MHDPNEKLFAYAPEIEYRSISAEDSEKIVELLEPFKKGYAYPLESHILNADGLRGYLNSAAVTEEIYADFRFHSKEIEDALMQIVRAYSELEMELQARQLDTLAQREYFNVFSDIDMDQAKIDFLKMLKVYEHLKNFNRDVGESWGFLRTTFEAIKPNTLNRLFLEQVLMYKIYPRIELTEQTDLLLRRMAYILKIKHEEQVAGKTSAEGEYTSLITYQISVIFQKDLESIIETTPQVKAETRKPKETWKDIRETCIKTPYLLDSRGDQLFNQSYLYILKMNEDRVTVEEQKIKRAMYIETHLGAEDTALRQDLIRKFISQAKSKDRLSEYTNFLHEYFDFTKDTLLLHFMEWSESQKNLFCYHLGPVYFLKIVMHFMREGRTGFIHRHLKKDQMIRELPFEYLKYIQKDWWDLKIYQRVNTKERNSVEKFGDIIQEVRKLWRNDHEKVLQAIAKESTFTRAFKLHDLKALQPLMENEISYLFYSIYVRFLGPDFLYLPVMRQTAS